MEYRNFAAPKQGKKVRTLFSDCRFDLRNIIAKASVLIKFSDFGIKIPKLLARRIVEKVDANEIASDQPKEEAIEKK